MIFFRSARNPLPISFRYNDQASAEFLKDWQPQWATSSATGGASHNTLTLTDPKTGLQVRCEVTTHSDFPAVEWVAYFKNTGAANTPIIADIQPLDTLFPSSADQPCVLYQTSGGRAQTNDFAPSAVKLELGDKHIVAPSDGRTSSEILPFFNLEMDAATPTGVISAIGWTGQWRARFERATTGLVHATAGMAQTHLKLLKGEEIRTPRMLLLFWENEALHGHNMLRQFILAYHTPQRNGKRLQAPVCTNEWGDRLADTHIGEAELLKRLKLVVDCYWIDAGWHGEGAHNSAADVVSGDWATQVGNWYPRKSDYPDGLKPVGDEMKAVGMDFLLWFEPERVYRDTQIAREHPEWLLGPAGSDRLFNLGIPEARRYLTDLISGIIEQGGVTGYRQDFNINPAPFWKEADTPDRVGMTEIRHIEGLYAYWDEMLARHPNLFIDNCSSGGRRLDLETTSRSIPLWRSDLQADPSFSNPTAMQNQTHGLGLWLPLSAGVSFGVLNTYDLRSALSAGVVSNWAAQSPGAFPIKWCQDRLAEIRAAQPYFYGDFYPLTDFSLSEWDWMIWQFHRTDLNEGMLLMFRRAKNDVSQVRVFLRGLNGASRYELRSFDGAEPKSTSGSDLIENGIVVQVQETPGSALFTYRSV